MKLTNIMPTEGYCIAVWVASNGEIQSEQWRICNGVIESWDGQWEVIFDMDFYSSLDIQWVLAE